jgi:hypothetical protein
MRKINAEVTCSNCRRILRGVLHIDYQKIVDSDGFWCVGRDEFACDECLSVVQFELGSDDQD